MSKLVFDIVDVKLCQKNIDHFIVSLLEHLLDLMQIVGSAHQCLFTRLRKHL